MIPFKVQQADLPKHEVVRDLSKHPKDGYEKGRSIIWQIAWHVVSNLVFRAWWCPRTWRPAILRCFGARVGERCLIRERVHIQWPWKLSLGDNVWIGFDAILLNLEPIEIGSNVCISQRAFLCTGNHDMNSATLEFRNEEIRVEDGAWITADVFVPPGTTITLNEVLKAGSVARKGKPFIDLN